MTVKAVVWDIGNVLVEWHPERIYDPLVGVAERERLFHDVGLMAMNVAIDAGAPFAASVEALARAHPADAAAILIWRDRWPETFDPVIAGSVRLMRTLRAKGVANYALSNFGAETFAMGEVKHPFLTEFDARFISAHLGVNKPDAAIYAAVEAAVPFAPSELVFVDDKAENIAAAHARGWRGHVFDGIEGWARRLVDEGLLTAVEAGV